MLLLLLLLLLLLITTLHATLPANLCVLYNPRLVLQLRHLAVQPLRSFQLHERHVKSASTRSPPPCANAPHLHLHRHVCSALVVAGKHNNAKGAVA
jgi:hypothetical protein